MDDTLLTRLARPRAMISNMRYQDGEATLREMLAVAGVRTEAPAPAATWEVLKEFVKLEAEGVDPYGGGDLFLFEWGIYDWHDGNGERFQIGLTRQFSIYEDGEYHHMEQLQCTFFYSPTSQLRALGSGTHWIDGDPSEGLTEIMTLPVFALVQDPTAVPVEHLVLQYEV